jgi:hypothetical protein
LLEVVKHHEHLTIADEVLDARFQIAVGLLADAECRGRRGRHRLAMRASWSGTKKTPPEKSGIR